MFWMETARRLLGAGTVIAGITTATDLQVQVREPLAQTYRITLPDRAGKPAGAGIAWLLAQREGSSDRVLLGRQLVVQLHPDAAPDQVLPADIPRRLFAPGLWILEADDAASALALNQTLLAHPEVTTVHPVRRRLDLHLRAYAPRPNDPLYPRQWHLENRNSATGRSKGVDLNVRAAWGVTRGTNITVAVADSGFIVDHPDLGNAIGAPHYDFFGDRPDEPSGGGPMNHGTACAGLIAATANNATGIVGLAPDARLASWAIFGLFDFGLGDEEIIADDASLAKMFRHDLNAVAVQNHSWGSTSLSLSGIDALSDAAIAEAVTVGRGGRGVILVRACGNERESLTNSNDDGFAGDPRTVAVAAIRADGRATSFSSPGANVLVSAPSGDPISGFEEDPAAPNIVTTDLLGPEGYNPAAEPTGDYGVGATGFFGTSASSPEISGVCALILGANPGLGYRDVQQILVQASRHYDFADSDVRTNGAGFVVSHNVGFGVPDTGWAVALARHWSNRPAVQTVRATVTTTRSISDDSLRLVLTGSSVPASLNSVRCLPSQGPHPETGTDPLPLVYVGLGNTNINLNLRGKAALIQRGDNFFSDKINRAAKAGAAYAVIYNNVATEPQLVVMFATAFTPIPAIFISKANGDTLRNYVLAQPTHTARITLRPTVTTWNVADHLRCEHVGIRLRTTHTARADLRITLVSPAGTRSILQFINNDDEAGPRDWTYWTTHHFFESAAGEWRLEVTDERNQNTGSITYAQLILQGTRITDTDRDGLDDTWERNAFGDLRFGPLEDPDGDGMNNAREQCLTTQPNRYDPLIPIGFEAVNGGRIRVTSPLPPGRHTVDVASEVEGSYGLVERVTNGVPYVEVFAPAPPADTFRRFVRTRLTP